MHIHYFQRYHSKGNVDTSNAMLMLSRLYTYSSSKFYAFLKEYILPNDSEPELGFILQEKSLLTVPDATIKQKSFKITVETKLHGRFDMSQLMNHLLSFGDEEYKVLLTLDPRPMKAATKEKFELELSAFNASLIPKSPIIHKNMTFEGLIEGMRSVINERDDELIAVLDDFEEYCFSGDLIPDDDKWMRAIVAGTSFKDNMDLSLYYDLAERGFSNHAYLGLYTQKSVRAIGKIIKTVVSKFDDGLLSLHPEGGSSMTDDEEKRILEAIERSKAHGFDLNVSERYFLVEKFYGTDFQKTTPYPIQKSKFFDLEDLLKCKKLPEVPEIAERLRYMTW